MPLDAARAAVPAVWRPKRCCCARGKASWPSIGPARCIWRHWQMCRRWCRVNQGGRGCDSTSRYNADGTGRIFTHWKLQAFGAPKLW